MTGASLLGLLAFIPPLLRGNISAESPTWKILSDPGGSGGVKHRRASNSRTERDGQELQRDGGREATYYQKLSHRRVQCALCFRECIIYEGERGECRNRENRGGTLYSIVYAKPSAVQVDPIEKEPQYHMLPGTSILCFGTAGCNFRCRFCQNWHLSQRSLEEINQFRRLDPEDAVSMALERGIPTISFTYNEPTSFYEWVYDTSRCAQEAGLHILWHSNGAMNTAPLRDLLRYTDAVTIDLKGFSEQVYATYSSAELAPVLKTLQVIKEEGVWLEIVNLTIPTVNDDPDDVARMCRWIVETLGPEVPLHFSRFFPAYRMTQLPPTPVETLERSLRIARESGLLFVTLGNVPGHRFNSTFCPDCGEPLIRRVHFQIVENRLLDGCCPGCGRDIPGLWHL